MHWTGHCEYILDMTVYVTMHKSSLGLQQELFAQCWLFPDAAGAQQAALAAARAATRTRRNHEASPAFRCQQRSALKQPVVCCSTPDQCHGQVEHTLLGFQGSFLGPGLAGLQALQHAPAALLSSTSRNSMKFYAQSDVGGVLGAIDSAASCAVVLDPLQASVPGTPWNQASLSALSSHIRKLRHACLIMDCSNHSIGRFGALFPHDLFASGSGGAFAGLDLPASSAPSDMDPLMEKGISQQHASALLESVPRVQASPHCLPDALILGRGLTLAPTGVAALLLSPALAQAVSTGAAGASFHPRSEQLRRMAVEPHCGASAALVHGTAAAQPAAVRYCDDTAAAEQTQEGVRVDLQEPWMSNAVVAVKRAVRRSVPVARLLLSYLDRLPVAHRDQVQDVFGPPPHPCSNGSDHCALDATIALKGSAQRVRHAACAGGLLLQSADGFVGLEDSAVWNKASMGASRPWHADRYLRIAPPMTLREEDARAGLAVLDASFSNPTDLL